MLAILLAYFINPLVTYLENKLTFSRGVTTFIVISLLSTIIISLLTFIFIEFIQGTTYLAEKLPAHFQVFMRFIESFLHSKIIPMYENALSFIQSLNQSQQTMIDEYLHNMTAYIASTGADMLRDLLLKLPTLLSMIPYSLTIVILIIIATFLITNDWYRLKEILRSLLPKRSTHTLQNIVGYLEKSLFGFFKAQFSLIFITGCLIFSGLLLLRIDHALTISILIALIDLLPFIGTGTVFIPWIGYLFLIGDYSLTIHLTLLYMLILITRQILEPKILATNIGVTPLAALFTLFISIQIWGVLPGIIISPFLLILTNALYQAGVMGQIWKFVKG